MERPDIGERMILQQLNDHRDRLITIDDRLRHIEVSIGVLKTKAATLGALAGFIPGMIMYWISRGG